MSETVLDFLPCRRGWHETSEAIGKVPSSRAHRSPEASDVQQANQESMFQLSCQEKAAVPASTDIVPLLLAVIIPARGG